MPPSVSHAVSSLLAPSRIRVGLPGDTKEAVIGSVVDLLDGAGLVTSITRVRADVERREALMSTGVGKGLALPHARTPGVKDTIAAFAVTQRPVSWGSDDGPVRLVLLLVGPEEERGLHVRLLGRVSRLMSDDAFRARLLAAETPTAVLAAFQDADDRLG